MDYAGSLILNVRLASMEIRLATEGLSDCSLMPLVSRSQIELSIPRHTPRRTDAVNLHDGHLNDLGHLGLSALGPHLFSTLPKSPCLLVLTSLCG